MDKGPLSQESVAQAAKEHVVAMYADASDQRNPSVAFKKYKVRGIPHIAFVNSKGKILKRLPHNQLSAAGIVKAIQEVAKK